MKARRVKLMGAWALALLVPTLAAAADPKDLAGSPKSVAVEPAESGLVGRRATAQLLATATYADGGLRDLTRALEWVSLNPEVAVVTRKGRVVSKGNGTAIIPGVLPFHFGWAATVNALAIDNLNNIVVAGNERPS